MLGFHVLPCGPDNRSSQYYPELLNDWEGLRVLVCLDVDLSDKILFSRCLDIRIVLILGQNLEIGRAHV